jgi:hypothetical protein
MSFETFLNQFKSKCQDPKAAFNYVFATERKDLDKYRPTPPEVMAFIDSMRAAILSEEKPRSKDRAAALDKIYAYNKDPGKPYFPGIDPHVFAFQLALRIREPSLLNQAKVGICGENSLMIFFAKNTPSEFAEYAISLMRTGKGKFHGQSVEPSATTWRGESIWELNKEKLAAVDFVTVASLAPSLFGDIKEGTTPEQVCALLSKAGFSNTQDKIDQREEFPGSEDSIRNLKEAAAAVKANKIVILGTHSEWVEMLRSLKTYYAKTWPELGRGSGKKWEELNMGTPIAGEPFVQKRELKKRKPGPSTRHWILVTYLEPTETHVTIKLYSWQNPLHAKFKLETFLSYYEGYVAADPPADETGYLGDSDELF